MVLCTAGESHKRVDDVHPDVWPEVSEKNVKSAAGMNLHEEPGKVTLAGAADDEGTLKKQEIENGVDGVGS